MINGELIIDFFACGGGASVGIESAFGKQVDIAVNHNSGRMTEQEAINVLEKYTDDTLSPVIDEAHRMAITAIEEVQQYWEIGTVEECREAVEKQKAKKPNLEGDGYADGHMVYDTWICPCCGISYEVDYDDYKYCPDCGQRIDWSE